MLLLSTTIVAVAENTAQTSKKKLIIVYIIKSFSRTVSYISNELKYCTFVLSPMNLYHRCMSNTVLGCSSESHLLESVLTLADDQQNQSHSAAPITISIGILQEVAGV